VGAGGQSGLQRQLCQKEINKRKKGKDRRKKERKWHFMSMIFL
jgi:hypothetical protein